MKAGRRAAQVHRVGSTVECMNRPDLPDAVSQTTSPMADAQWRCFFMCCIETLGSGSTDREYSESWVSWTTYQRLLDDAGYWGAGLPDPLELDQFRVGGGQVWRTAFFYSELAHVVVPRRFCRPYTRRARAGAASYREQDLHALSRALDQSGIEHEFSPLALQIRLF